MPLGGVKIRRQKLPLPLLEYFESDSNGADSNTSGKGTAIEYFEYLSTNSNRWLSSIVPRSTTIDAAIT